MAEKTIKHASFWYVDDQGGHRTATRGETVDITRDEDLKRGEQHEAFATDVDLVEGSEFSRFLATRGAAEPPASVFLDPAEVEGRTSAAGSADPRIQSGMVTPTGDVPSGGDTETPSGRPSVNAPKAAWVAYHVDQRPDDVDEASARDQAEAMNKPDLVRRAGVDYQADAGQQS